MEEVHRWIGHHIEGVASTFRAYALSTQLYKLLFRKCRKCHKCRK